MRRQLKSVMPENSGSDWNSVCGTIWNAAKRSTISGTTMEHSKVLLLGASGRLGGMLQGFWPQSDDLICHSRANRDGYVNFDPLKDPDALRGAIAGSRAVICLSGITPAHAAATGDPLSLNTELAVATLRAADRAGGKRVFLASSAAVYGRATGPLAEDMACDPVSDYGRAKLEMEKAASAFAQVHPLPVTVLRIGNVAGADAILGGWSEGMMLDAYPDGRTPQRSYIGPQTLAQVLHHLCRAKTLPDILNIAAPGAIEMGALLDAAGLAWAPRPANDQTIARVALQTKRLEKEFDFAPNANAPATMVSQWRKYERG